MDQTAETYQEPECSTIRPKSSTRVPRKKMQKTRSFTDAMKEKYCSQENYNSECEFIIDIVIRGKPRNNGPTSAELAHLRNVDLSNRRVSTGGLPDSGLVSLCPNVTDLDLSLNLLESWAELLPLLSQLPHLKFLNLSRNHITRHKEELWRWSTPLPKVENMVLNSTGVPLREVLALARLMPTLRELHICCNYYRDLGSVELAIKDGALSKLECLHLNENIITSWSEVWKLRSLPCLTQLILSENPLCDVFYDASGQSQDSSMCEMDSPDITCHSDGEDSSFGSPHFRYPAQKVSTSPRSHKVESPGTSPANHTTISACRRLDFSPKAAPKQTEPSTYSQSEVVSHLIDDLITHACKRISVQESCERCEQNTVEDVRQNRSDNQNRAENAKRSQNENDAWRLPRDSVSDNINCNHSENRPRFFLDDCESLDVGDDRKESCSVNVERDSHAYGEDSSRADTQQTFEFDAEEDLQNCNTSEREVSEADEEDGMVPFAQLNSLCLSRTSICEMDHIHVLNDFPHLRSLRIMDITLFSDLHQEDRRKLFVASLPKVEVLNGSEVTGTERDKAERHYLRHFLDQEDKNARYLELEKKHGPIQPLCDIDLGARFQKYVTLTFMLNGVEQFSETVSVLQPVGKLRRFIAERLAIPRRMFHYSCGPYQDVTEHTIDELFLDGLPMSRFDFMDGDELHVEFKTYTQTRQARNKNPYL